MKRWVYTTSVIAPLAVLTALAALFAVNVPVLDQWELVELFRKYHEGTVGFADFFAQHNEHRLFFPRLVMFGLAIASNWNVTWEMAASIVLAATSFVFLYRILAQTLGRAAIRWVAAVIISLIWFSPIQFENWLWGWQLQWYLNTAGLVIAIWALSAWKAAPLWRIAIAALAATLATYSLGSGFLVWLVCLPLLWCSRPLRRFVWVWIVCAAMAIGIHYIGYQDPPNSPARSLALRNPLGFLQYVAIYLTHPLSPLLPATTIIAPLYAASLIAGLLYVYKHIKEHFATLLLPWGVLGAYACLAAVSTAITRLGLGVGQAYASRYTTIAGLLLIAFVVVLCALAEYRPQKRAARMVWAALAAITVLVVLNFAKGTIQMQQHGSYLQKLHICAKQARSAQDPCLVGLYPAPTVVWDRLQYIRSVHWGGL